MRYLLFCNLFVIFMQSRHIKISFYCFSTLLPSFACNCFSGADCLARMTLTLSYNASFGFQIDFIVVFYSPATFSS